VPFAEGINLCFKPFKTRIKAFHNFFKVCTDLCTSDVVTGYFLGFYLIGFESVVAHHENF